mmetsp:Transcript_50619/g.101818  ORF Transcript_50619/g.101818 Transcript_50619/m.101818 type:complete len:186 (+) Transcript_50619:292-849(+)
MMNRHGIKQIARFFFSEKPFITRKNVELTPVQGPDIQWCLEKNIKSGRYNVGNSHRVLVAIDQEKQRNGRGLLRPTNRSTRFHKHIVGRLQEPNQGCIFTRTVAVVSIKKDNDLRAKCLHRPNNVVKVVESQSKVVGAMTTDAIKSTPISKRDHSRLSTSSCCLADYALEVLLSLDPPVLGVIRK